MFYKVHDVLETLDNIYAEVGRQESLWGVQIHPDGTGDEEYKRMADEQRELVDKKAKEGTRTWADIWLEEVYEALACDTPAELIEEIEQADAVGVSWIRAIRDR